MKRSKRPSRSADRLDPAGWVRGDWRKRHNLTDADISEMMKPENVRVNISIEVPLDVLDFFKAKALKNGGSYQTRINQILRAYVDEHRTAASGSSSELAAATRFARSALNRLLETLKDAEAATAPPARTSRRRANLAK